MNAIKLRGLKQPLPVSQIMYVLGDGNYSTVYLTDGSKYVASMTMRLIADRTTFLLRISKGTLINPDYVKIAPTSLQVRRMVHGKLVMSDGASFAVARRRWALMDVFKSE